MEYKFNAVMYAVAGNTQIERSLAVHNYIQEMYPENSPELVQVRKSIITYRMHATNDTSCTQSYV